MSKRAFVDLTDSPDSTPAHRYGENDENDHAANEAKRHRSQVDAKLANGAAAVHVQQSSAAPNGHQQLDAFEKIKLAAATTNRLLGRDFGSITLHDGDAQGTCDAARHTETPSCNGDPSTCNAWLKELYLERLQRRGMPPAVDAALETIATSQHHAHDSSHTAGPSASIHSAASRRANDAPSTSSPQRRTFHILTYNVWFREDVALDARLGALGGVIEEHHYPEIIALQEVTPDIYSRLANTHWWHRYTPSNAQLQSYFTVLLCRKDAARVHGFRHAMFENSQMGRGLLQADVEVCGTRCIFATSHLESPFQGQSYSRERQEQLKQSLQLLMGIGCSNIVFCGDMNWDDDKDGQLPLPAGWIDAWTELNPGDAGFTYDCQRNAMLPSTWKLRKRLDRVVAHMPGFETTAATLVGTKPIPNLVVPIAQGRSTRQSAVLPSDHFGLFVEFSCS